MRFFLPLVFSAFLLVSSCTNKSDDTTLTTLYFIRHAEKDRSNPENKNPHLTTTGLNRAQYWSEIFKNVKFDAIYSTDYNRTIETAKPTANSNNLTIQIYDAIQLDTRNILENNKGNNVLIVGHSDTTPKFVNKFLGTESYLDIDDSNNGNLYILTITDTMVTDLLLTVNPQQ
ncbi:Histidine phosphatase superfamily (branch 1) [Bizionia echini]|uniref:Histidine phosphatase superfamily (Branch 1) n=1 Tax=Bizionia echini TaxID=649333 RepID=A0A1I5BYK4_9FLAO|nr:phosphoglycerate mutase family protein [Bizionia echini]SFN79774.1 Histidine phosphatase superfamily (branch 1) [Bizionia echini]